MQGDNLMMGLVWSLHMHNPGGELLASNIVVFIILYREEIHIKHSLYYMHADFMLHKFFYFLIYFSLNDVHGICLIIEKCCS